MRKVLIGLCAVASLSGCATFNELPTGAKIALGAVVAGAVYAGVHAYQQRHDIDSQCQAQPATKGC